MFYGILYYVGVWPCNVYNNKFCSAGETGIYNKSDYNRVSITDIYYIILVKIKTYYSYWWPKFSSTYLIFTASADGCPLNCSYICINDGDFKCVCKLGFQLVGTENCEGRFDY